MAGSIFLAASLGGILSLPGGTSRVRDRCAEKAPAHANMALVISWFVTPGCICRNAPAHRTGGTVATLEEQERANGGYGTSRHRSRQPDDDRQTAGLGYGLGTFVEVFPRYRTFYTNSIVNAAHNEYVQALLELGIVGFLLIMALIVLLFREGLRKAGGWQHDFESAMALAALIGCSGILIHSLCDFNLQIPANAAVFSVLAGIAVARPLSISSSAAARKLPDSARGGTGEESHRGGTTSKLTGSG